VDRDGINQLLRQEIYIKIMEMGYMCNLKNRKSVSTDTANAIASWRQLQAGGSITKSQTIAMYDAMPKRGTSASVKHGSKKLLDAVHEEDVLNYQNLSQNFGLIVPLEVDAARALNLSWQEARYIEMLEARGEDILAPARIKVSTFHAMKGGEDDNCAVFLASTKMFSVMESRRSAQGFLCRPYQSQKELVLNRVQQNI
jgi:hypothetical protein